MKTDDTIKVLNELIETSNDGKNGFMQAAEKIDDPKLKQMFQTRAQACENAARELRQSVVSLGGKPDQHGHAAGAMRRGWVSVRASLGDARKAVLEEVERGEDAAKTAYRKALQAELPADVRLTVERQYEGVLRNHDAVKALRDSDRAAA